MSLVAHKYTPGEMSPHELEATFAAREHTVDYLLKSLRDQIHTQTLSSFVITGPRGAGKSTIIHMVALRIRQDAELNAAWLPVVFPEEQFNLTSLRDLLAATLQLLGAEQISGAQEWLEKVEAEPDEEQSQQLAITALREITRQFGKRFILFIENLDHLLEQHLDNQMKGTLRRLLMTDPVMMIIGSTVHIFDALKRYDEAFFNYFGQVPLGRLTADQVTELLRKRAEFDHNDQFLRELPQQQAKVRTLVHLTGGNPRFVLMLYELLSLQKVTTIVQYLRKLVDELTPLLKDEMEQLPAQQRKIIHALMEKGGTAQPADLVAPTRLRLNAINVQLRRLKDAQFLELLGGGKGRAANYTVPDKLFSIWYQMRYLTQNRRRIELFVDVLRIWFEEEERVRTLRHIAAQSEAGTPSMLRECAATAEYLAASLKGTIHERLATELCIDSWVKADLREAAFAYADLSRAGSPSVALDDVEAHISLAKWLGEHGDFDKALESLDNVLDGAQPHTFRHAYPLAMRGLIRYFQRDTKRALEDLDAAFAIPNVHPLQVAMLFFFRAMSKSQIGDKHGAIADLTEVLKTETLPVDVTNAALLQRAQIQWSMENRFEALTDLAKVITTDGTKKADVAKALSFRASVQWQLNNQKEALSDAEKLIHLDGAPVAELVRALFIQASYNFIQKQIPETMVDFVKILELGIVDKEIFTTVAVISICFTVVKGNEQQFEFVIAQLIKGVNSSALEAAREIVVRILNNLPSLVSKEDWPKAWHALTAGLKPELSEAIKFLEPVCDVLEGKDPVLLDALPPEQREFALEVLSKFELKKEAELFKPNKNSIKTQ